MQRRPPRADWPSPEEFYTYPQHLREALQGTPAAPGVYTFHAADSTLPLYIGKSVNLRSRLLAHLRTPREARLLQQTARISHIRTAGDIGAQLLEAQLIKQLQPLHNKKLRRNKQLHTLVWDGAAPSITPLASLPNAHAAPAMYGLFASHSAAQQYLRDLADTHRLCLGALGLEKLPAGRPCFRAMLRQCAGVCCGQEPWHAHQARLGEALEHLRVATWPHPGAVGLVERSADLTQIHVVNNWCYLGSATTRAQAQKLARQQAQVAPAFDADGYRILYKPLLDGSAEIMPLHSA